MALGIRAAVDGGARVINISAGTVEQNQRLADAVDYAASHDVVLVASAANSAKRGDPVTYPAAHPSVIVIGAVDEAGEHQKADTWVTHFGDPFACNATAAQAQYLS